MYRFLFPADSGVKQLLKTLSDSIVISFGQNIPNKKNRLHTQFGDASIDKARESDSNQLNLPHHQFLVIK